MSMTRVLRAYITTGLFFMLIPGTLLGVVNLLQVSSRENLSTVSAAWLQAHGHAQVFGWIGSFILGIAFYALSRQSPGVPVHPRVPWVCWTLWTLGVSLRWVANVYAWRWRVLLPLSAAFELAAFLVFVSFVSGHRPAEGTSRGLDLWFRVVISAVIGFGATLVVNLVTSVELAWRGESPALSHLINQRFLVVVAWGFLAPFIWGFSTKWLPVLLGLGPLRPALLVTALSTNLLGIVLSTAGRTEPATWCFVVGALGVAVAIRIFEPAAIAPKTRGVSASFPIFVRIAYAWLVTAALLGVVAARWDISGGIWGASRHAFTVGFVSVMVFSIGQRVLPAFAGTGVLWSPRLMAWVLTLLVAGCALRVSSEILAYQHYADWAWPVLPVSAIVEMAAFTGFAANLLVSVYRS